MYMKAVPNQENTDRGTVMGLYWESNTGKNPCQALGWGKPSEHKLLDLIQMAGIPTEPRGWQDTSPSQGVLLPLADPTCQLSTTQCSSF